MRIFICQAAFLVTVLVTTAFGQEPAPKAPPLKEKIVEFKTSLQSAEERVPACLAVVRAKPARSEDEFDLERRLVISLDILKELQVFAELVSDLFPDNAAVNDCPQVSERAMAIMVDNTKRLRNIHRLLNQDCPANAAAGNAHNPAAAGPPKHAK